VNDWGKVRVQDKALLVDVRGEQVARQNKPKRYNLETDAEGRLKRKRAHVWRGKARTQGRRKVKELRKNIFTAKKALRNPPPNGGRKR